MASTENIYSGARYWFDSSYGLAENYGESFLNIDYRFPTSQFGFPTDPRVINQIDATSKKISTGAKTIEVSAIQTQILEAIPKHFFKEINRLKKLTGVDLTFHGPLVEATGLNLQAQRWNESERIHVERQMISAVKRSHELDPKGNVVVTFHSSNGLPDPETRFINEKGEEVLKDFWIIDDFTGRFGNIAPRISHLKEEVIGKDPKIFLERENKRAWYDQLQDINFNVNRGAREIDQVMKPKKDEPENIRKFKESILKLYGSLGTPEAQNLLKEFEKEGIKSDLVEEYLHALSFGEINLRQSYQGFQTLYDQAYDAAKRANNKEDLAKLDKFREEIKPKIKEIEEAPEKINILSDELRKGVDILRTIKTPQIYKPMREWAIDKSSTTFANVAFDSYKKFKNTAPIISIENPPIGMGLARAEDLRDIVEEARKKFVQQAKEKLNMSESEAQRQAEKLIGVTWDVGHINMLRGHGYEEKHIVKETKKIAPYVKHVHLSDNFGIEHTELPMGMGNVPTKKHLELIHKYNEQVKKIAETGNWFEPFKFTPVKQTLTAFGSPVYGMNKGPYWNQIADASAGYFLGQGAINPQIHHSMYGAGFANLPVELGGQMAGQSRVSGAPIE